MSLTVPTANNNAGPVSGGGPDTEFNNTRLMSDLPHVDGFVFGRADQLGYDNRANQTVTRVSKGVWALVNTAGVQTYNTSFSFGDQIQRLGEQFFFQGANKGSTNITPGSNYPPGVGGPPSYQGSPSVGAQAGGLPFPKGVLITDVFATYTVATVALTSATLRMGYTQYLNNVAINQADILAATATGALATQANPYYVKIPIPAANQVWMNIDACVFEVELNYVAAATTVMSLYGIGAHVMFNYN